jgi:aminoglycoside phosphotransferase (APT) family kinase protein
MEAPEPLTLSQITTLVHSVFPEAGIASCTPFAGQHSNLNYDMRLTTLMTAVVLKVYSPANTVAAARRENHLLHMLTSETGVPVPRVLRFDDSAELIPAVWALHTRLPGDPLSQILDLLDDGQLESVGYETGRYLGRIHQIPLSTFGELFVPDTQSVTTEKGHFIAQATEYLKACRHRALLSDAVVDVLGSLFARTPLLDRRQACLLHGDYGTANVIVERSTTGFHVTGVLEFEYALGGSPERDMAKLFTWEMDGLPAFEKGFLDGYIEFGEIGPRFWDRLRLYQSLVCLAYLAQSHGVEKDRRASGCQAWLQEYVRQQGI